MCNICFHLCTFVCQCVANSSPLKWREQKTGLPKQVLSHAQGSHRGRAGKVLTNPLLFDWGLDG